MADNLDFVGDKLGIDLILLEREKAAVNFAADFLAEAGDGSLAIIGNQLERTHHAGLGKLSASLSNPDAKRCVRASAVRRLLPLLVYLDGIPPQPDLMAPLRWQSAATWLLGCDS